MTVFSRLLLVALTMATLSIFTYADSITLTAGGPSATATYVLAGTNASAQAVFSFDGTTIRVEFRNTSTNDFKLAAVGFFADKYSLGSNNVRTTVSGLPGGKGWNAGGDEELGQITTRANGLAVTGGIGYLPNNANLLSPNEGGVATFTLLANPTLGTPPFQSVTLSFTNAYFINPNAQPVILGQILLQTAPGNFSGAAVPEPATLILLGSGLAGVALRSRKRKK